MACEDCGKDGSVMMAMKPGKDGKPWELCGKCWMDGRRPMRLGRFKVTEIANPQLYDALVAASERTAGLMDRARGADDPKASVGDFDQKPRKATRSRRA